MELPGLWLASMLIIGLAIRYNAAIPSRLAKPARAAGLLTYPLYLVHSEIGSAVMRRTASAGGWIALGAAVAVALIAAYIVVKAEPLLRRHFAAALHFRRRELGTTTDLP